MRCPFTVNVLLTLLAVLAIESKAEQNEPRKFPTAPGPGHVTASGRFVKETTLPREDLPRETISPAHARFKVDLDTLLPPHDMAWEGEMPGVEARVRLRGKVEKRDGRMVFAAAELRRLDAEEAN